ncbi:MAG: Sua5/YciO/YrdC/YwlC family protein [Desulfobacterales bacterium]
MKNRDKKPFSFICSDLKNISDYAKVSNYAYKTMKRLPGPTHSSSKAPTVPKIMLTRRKTAGIRVPDHEICLQLVRELAPDYLHQCRHAGWQSGRRSLPLA